MFSSTIARKPISSTETVDSYQYSLTVIDASNKVIEIFQYFDKKPQTSDWLKVLSGWYAIGFKLHSQPRLVRFISV